MPNYGAKVSSTYISSDAMHDFLAKLPAFMLELYGNRNLTVCYGWACNLHADLLYQPMGVPLDTFPYFLQDSIEQGIFVVCGSDLIIASPDSKLKIVICHESDIHLDGLDDDAIHSLRERFPELDFRTADQWRAVNPGH